MHTMDVVVLVGYFVTMVAIGAWCASKIKKQEDFFMGGRGFGKLLQTFAAFGAGTGAQDPINVGRTTWTSGLSGVWSALMWLFVTPVYWIVGVWYRRMRHITLGDWFVERYESKSLGVAYTFIAFTFVIFYLSTMFSAISNVATPLLGEDTVLWLVGLVGSTEPEDLKYVLVPLISVIVVAYGIAGGLAAAYWTDLIQGICIILLSILLIPYGLWGLVEKFGDPATMGLMDGFRIMHERVTPENFQLFGGPRAGEFPLHYIISLTMLGMVGVVVQPHFIATGGGSAKNESAARIGLVTGNFLKRFCTIGWALTALIVVALLADSSEIAQHPDRAWGVASREILGSVTIAGFHVGLVGLMLACLLAALMSTADCNMVIMSGLLVRNIYAPYINPKASEATYVRVGRITGLLVIVGAALISVQFYDVFGQYTFALEIPILAAAPFWVGMYWRRATRVAAGGTMAFSLCAFFLIPMIVPWLVPGLRTDPNYTLTNNIVTIQTTRPATPADVARRQAAIILAQEEGGGGAKVPPLLQVGDPFLDEFTTGGKPIFWTGSVEPVGDVQLVEVDRQESPDQAGVTITKRHEGPLKASGFFNLDYLLYSLVGIDLQKTDKAMLQTLRLPPRLILPFVVMIVLSWLTKPNSAETLDRYYAKMKTPVDSDPAQDHEKLQQAYANPRQLDHKKLFPGTNLEIQKPTFTDIAGFVISVGICCLFVWLAWWVANIGA